MSRDIRSFFTVISKKSGPDSKKDVLPPTKKKPKRIVDSDDEDIVASTPEQSTQKKKPQKRQKIETLSSDSEDEASKNKAKTPKKENKSLLKPVNITDVFKNAPIKQAKVEVVEKSSQPTNDAEKETKKSKSKRKKNTKGTELGIHNDTAFEKTLLDLDDDDELFEQTLSMLDEAEKEVLSHDDKKENSTSEVKSPKMDSPEDSKKENQSTNKGERKRSRSDSSSDKKTPKKQKIEHTDSGIDPGQEAHEKKRYSAMLYQKTGVLDSLESEEFDNLIKQHGGRVVHAISKKVNYVVVGEDPGPAKLAKAESLNIPNITEDELLDLILVKSGMKPKYCKKDTSPDSEDLGIEADSHIKTSKEDKSNKSKQDNKEKIETKPKKDISKTSAKKKDEEMSSKPSTSKIPETEIQSKSIEKRKIEIDPSGLALTEKYKPNDIKGIIGQQSEGSNLYKLKHWLQNWYKNQDPKVKKSLVKPSPWAKKDDGAYFKCALLSGPPGVGKTTSATLVAQNLGLDIVEFNASDTRSKRLLHEEVSQLLCTNTIAGFATGKSRVNKNRVLLMDEVDGMAGNEDRGGIQELIQLIKNSSIPIICMCNDRNHPKIRSLVNYCFDLRFTKPKLEQIRGAMMSVCFKEGIDINGGALTEIIAGTGCDVRQTLNHLAVLATTGKSIGVDEAAKEAKASKKDIVMGPWEVCRAVFTESEHKDMSVADKARLFFFDYSIGPLFVQENYLKVQPHGKLSQKEMLRKAMLAADAISVGDLLDAKIRGRNNWALLESQAMFSSVIPGHLMSGHFVGQINFPAWLGKNSKRSKFNRILCEIQAHTRTSASASKLAVKLDYLVPLKNAILLPLKKGMEGIDQAVNVMKTYNLLREDFDGLLELCQWQRGDNQMSGIETKVKSAFTRTYNKQVTQLPYAPTAGITKKKSAAEESDLLGEEEEIVESDNEDEDITKNAMIKVKKQTGNKGKKATDEASTKKKGESKKGKGKKTK
ncbi:replication factor C subunit 1 [Asbolus verrucosus]|uniref:Replication factor C subunit 1 n=1 Tax=Asbolus verrucosus TaxID=1661398 RepID=A0A482VFZ7_ASBVE|nr:replication factor C subunit 1 [Asbolus verrucosus]